MNAPVHLAPRQPIPVLVVPVPAERARPVVGDLSGDDGLIPAVLDLAQRLACEAAMTYACGFMQAETEAETGRTGWRAHLSAETAHVIHVLEESGFAEFTLERDTLGGGS